MTRTRLLLLLLPINAVVAVAGLDLEVKCETPKCGFHDLVSFGGGFVYCEITGYCTTCREFVAIKWKRSSVTGDFRKRQDESVLPEKAPAPVGSVWNPATSMTANLYPCPKCKKPFMEVNYHDFWVVPEKVTGTVFSMMDKAATFQDDQIEALMKASAKLTEANLMICPSCTNLTLGVKRRGVHD